MTTTELIELLKKYEIGGISKRPREISITINGKLFMGEPTISVNGTGDTCLKREGNRLVDRRGEDYDNCKLYVTDAKKEKEHIKRNEIIFGRKLKGVTNGRGKKVHTE